MLEGLQHREMPDWLIRAEAVRGEPAPSGRCSTVPSITKPAGWMEVPCSTVPVPVTVIKKIYLPKTFGLRYYIIGNAHPERLCSRRIQ